MTTISTTTTEGEFEDKLRVKRGRPFRYDIDTKRAIVAAYTEAPRGERIHMAEQLGVSFNTLLVYICNWRKEIRGLDAIEEYDGILEERIADVG